jgi:NitT/TauT family transport system ATP-binding protein
MNFITVSKVGKVYQRNSDCVAALSDFTMQVSEGESVAVLGPSGCGKTTLLRIVAGLIAPTHGRVMIGLRAPSDYFTEGGIGFVFQKPILFPWRTVIQNVVLPAELGRANLKRSPERAQELLSLMGLSGFETAYPHELSGGMFQRAAVARALMMRPKVLLLDEPFSALDDITREQLWLDFAAMREHESSTVIIVTHSVREAVFFGNRVLVVSPRPGHVRKEIHITLPESRNRAVVTSREFADICEEVRAGLS